MVATTAIRQAVAPVVGRADVLCGFLAVIALSLTVGDRSANKRRRKQLESCSHGFESDRKTCDQGSSGLPVGGKSSASTTRGMAGESKRQRVTGSQDAGLTADGTSAARKVSKSGRVSTATSSTADSTPTASHRSTTIMAKLTHIVPTADNNGNNNAATVGARFTNKNASPTLTPETQRPLCPISAPNNPTVLTLAGTAPKKIADAKGRQFLRGPTETKARKRGSLLSPTYVPLELVVAENPEYPSNGVVSDTGPGIARHLAALVFAGGATLCKETGVTVFGLVAGAEVVRFLDESGWRRSRAAAAATGTGVSGKSVDWAERFAVRRALAYDLLCVGRMHTADMYHK